MLIRTSSTPSGRYGCTDTAAAYYDGLRSAEAAVIDGTAIRTVAPRPHAAPAE